MRIFLTGGTGYLGGALARRLVERGDHVVALVRESSDTEALTELGVELSVGDVTDRFSMRPGMSGADWVIHAAAAVDLGYTPPEVMREVNVDGSENVASLAYKLGVGRLLNVSSMAAFGGSPDDGSLATESTAPHQPLPGTYSLTKHLGTECVRAWAERGLEVNHVFPGLIYGPPGKKSGTNALLRAFFLGRFPVLVGADRRTSWIYIDDVLDALLAIIDGAEPGRDYLLTGEVKQVLEVVTELERMGGAPIPRQISPGIAKLLTGLSSPLFRLRGRRPPVPREQIDVLSRHWAFDDSRARTELDWSPRSLADGLPSTVAMFRDS